MTFATSGSLETVPGKRDEIIALLVRHSPQSTVAGCLLFEVGVDPTDPELILITQLWESTAAYRAWRDAGQVQSRIAAAMPLVTTTTYAVPAGVGAAA